MSRTYSTGLVIAGWIHRIAGGVLIPCAAALAVFTAAGAAGLAPVLSLPVQVGETEFPDAGLAAQAGLLVLLVAVISVLPGAFRVLRLEQSHRAFGICMSDVAEAYRISHAADRAGAFRLPSEYDAVKERLLFLRAHPDLAALEPDILEVAAQMSQTSHELAAAFSDENVARARGFLRQREEEIARFEDRIARARETGDSLRRSRDEIAAAEAGLEGRIAELEAEFGDLLRDLGFVRPARGRNVIALSPAAAAE